jgi:hypothetical protein
MDEDDDLLPDDWEVALGLDPHDPADAVEDFDGDGLINYDEILFGFDPFNPDTDGDGTTDAEALHALLSWEWDGADGP